MRGLVMLAILVAPMALSGQTEIVIVYDQSAAVPGLIADWGFAAVVRHAGAPPVLFDTGNKPEVLIPNLRALRIDPAAIGPVVISHEHFEKAPGALEAARRGKAMWDYFWSNWSLDAFRQTEKLRERAIRGGAAPVVIAPGVFTTGNIGKSPPEQSLVIETSKGLIVLTACAHAGIGRVLDAARGQLKADKIRAVIGGLHLYDAGEREVSAAIEELVRRRVEQVGGAHCTGDAACARIREKWGGRTLATGVGRVLRFE